MTELFPAPETGGELTGAAAGAAVAALLDPGVADDAKADFLRRLRRRGETAGEVAAFARALVARAVDPEVRPDRLPGPLVDVCGTGGDRLDLFNVSTTAAFVLAAGGVAVAKHGNRAVSSRSGGADVLAALGVPLDLPPAAARQSLEAHGFAFFFAPHYHPTFAAVVPVRRQLAREGVSTIFNLLGPLLNPARPRRQLVGVFREELTATFAEVFRALGHERAWAVHGLLTDGTAVGGAAVATTAVAGGSAEGARGMDELSTLGPTRLGRWEEGQVTCGSVRPEEAGLPRARSLEELRGGDAAQNARITTGILGGEIGGAPRDLVLLNAAAGFCVAGLVRDLSAGVELGARLVRDGAARRKLAAVCG